MSGTPLSFLSLSSGMYRRGLQHLQMPSPRTAARAAQALVGGGGDNMGMGEGRLDHAGSHLQGGAGTQPLVSAA